jgi:hypothetical protein
MSDGEMRRRIRLCVRCGSQFRPSEPGSVNGRNSVRFGRRERSHGALSVQLLVVEAFEEATRRVAANLTRGRGAVSRGREADSIRKAISHRGLREPRTPVGA